MRIPKILILFVVFSTLVFAQNKESTNSSRSGNVSKTRANEILLKAKKAISSKLDISEIKSFKLSTEGIFNGGIKIIEKNNYSISLNNKIKRLKDEDLGTAKAVTEQTLNGNESTVKQSSSSIGGTPRSMFTKVNDPENAWIKTLKLHTSEILVPYVLDFAFVKTDGFKFLGVAKSDSNEAFVIQTKTDEDVEYQLLFDKENYQLLMMVKKFYENGKRYERNIYFSEYKENQGLKIPHKTVVSGNSTIGSKLYIERNLKKLSINPKFNEKTFEIKEK